MTPEERMARAEALAHEQKRHDMATRKSWSYRVISPPQSEFQWSRIAGPFISSDGTWLQQDADAACALRNAAPEVAAVLRGLVADLRALQDELDHVAPASERDHLSRASRRFCETLIGDREALRQRVRELEHELADLRAQVVSALSAAGPCEDERTA